MTLLNPKVKLSFLVFVFFLGGGIQGVTVNFRISLLMRRVAQYDQILLDFSHFIALPFFSLLFQEGERHLASPLPGV